jgi:histidinol-phosphate aminotransferase
MRAAAARMHRYPDGGAFRLKQALASRLDVSPSCILPGNGSNELLELIGHTFLSPDAEVVASECAFVVYRMIAAMFRSGATMVPMRDFTHDLPAMAEAIGPKTRVVFIGNPNNPTGTMVDQGRIDVFMRIVPESVVVCFDEAYIELVDPGQQPDVLRYVRQGRKLIVLRTFSKAYGLAGLRIGYAVASEECISLLNRSRQPFNVNAMAQAAALAALEDDRHVAGSRRMVRDGHAFFAAELPRIGLAPVPSVTNFFLLEVGRGREVFEKLEREGVIVRPMDGYGLPGYVRITVGTQLENEHCMRALSKVLAGRGGTERHERQ